MKSAKAARGFSLIELVIVVVIIAIIGAIAIPKMSRGAQGAGDSALIQDLSILNAAVDLYNAEHPSALLGQTGTTNTAAGLTTALTQYTDSSGTPSLTKTATQIYGPYVKTVPALPVGLNKGLTNFTVTGPVGTGSFAWFFNTATNGFSANLPADAADSDVTGKYYNSY